jgi:antitoxin MazE
MKTSIQKWGNSLALRIPEGLAEKAGLDEGSLIDLQLIEGRLVIVPASDSLDHLLTQINDDNLHDAVDTGDAVGNEVW